MIRTDGIPRQFGPAIEEQLRIASGGLPVAQIRSMEEVARQSTARTQFQMTLMSFFAGSALLLAAIGIYGLMAYSVQQRTCEIGIRPALGAQQRDVRNMIITQGMVLAAIGAAIGLLAALGLTRLLESFLYGVRPRDPLTFLTIPLFLGAVALLAIWLPARRATRINPSEALRCE